ncbi:MAG: histidine phosphatase family protein [Rhodobacteraceae bacterium]|nr:histidine phosphatase family protein [Paracoccaceae bacterium]
MSHQNGRPRGRPGSTLILTRHGDHTASEEMLKSRGRRRAEDLVRALDGNEIDAICSPGIARNLDTAAPLATARRLKVIRIRQEASAAALITEAGRSVLFIGNKGDLSDIRETLAVPRPPPLEYRELAILRADAAGRVSIVRRRD